MTSLSFNRMKTLLLVLIVVLQSFTAFSTTESQTPSRKIKRINQVQQTGRSQGAQTQTEPSQNLLTTALPFTHLPPAVTPLMAMALLQLLMQQQNSQYSPSQPMLQASAETFGDPAPVQETTHPMTGRIPEVNSVEERETKPEIQPEAQVRQETPQVQARQEQNQCSRYAGAGDDVGKSAGAISIGSSSCNTEVIGMDYVITNSHCLEGSRGPAKVVFGLGRGQSKKAFQCQAVEARNPKDRLDYAVIRCPGVGKHFPPVMVANRIPKVGEPIRIETHNFSRSGRVTKVTNNGRILQRGAAPGQSMATSAYGEPGNSGSGIYDKEGKWLGLLWGGIHDYGGRPTFFTPASKIVSDLDLRFPEVAKQIQQDQASIAACLYEGLDETVTGVQ